MSTTFDEEFKGALETEDELGLVIRAHIHIEASLNHFVESLLAHPSHLRKAKLDYSQKVNLAIAIGLLPKYEAPLLTLGTLRNAFAHQPSTQLTKDRVDNLYQSLSSEEKSLVQDSHQTARRKRPQDKIATFSKLPPKSRFILIAIALRAILVFAAKKAHQSGHLPCTTTHLPPA